MFTLLVGGIPTLKCCEAAVLSHWALNCCSPKVKCALTSFSASCSESKFRYIYELPVQGPNVWALGTLALRMPVPGFKERHLFRRSLGLTMPHLCVVLAGDRGLQLIEEAEAGAGTSQESVAPGWIVLWTGRAKQILQTRCPSFCCL